MVRRTELVFVLAITGMQLNKEHCKHIFLQLPQEILLGHLP